MTSASVGRLQCFNILAICKRIWTTRTWCRRWGDGQTQALELCLIHAKSLELLAAGSRYVPPAATHYCNLLRQISSARRQTYRATYWVNYLIRDSACYSSHGNGVQFRLNSKQCVQGMLYTSPWSAETSISWPLLEQTCNAWSSNRQLRQRNMRVSCVERLVRMNLLCKTSIHLMLGGNFFSTWHVLPGRC